MENDRLDWLTSYGSGYGYDGSYEGTPASSATKKTGAKKDGDKKSTKVQLPKLTLLLLLSGTDADDCCAQNFERTVFRDAKVIGTAKTFFTNYRLDRDGEGARLVAKYKLEKKKPAILLIDEQGELAFKAQICSQPKKVHSAMCQLVTILKKKVVYSHRAEKRVQELWEVARKKRFSDALRQLDRINEKLLVPEVDAQVDKLERAIRKVAVKRLKRAERLEKAADLEAARELVRDVRKTFGRLPKIKAVADKMLARIDTKRKQAA